MREILFKAKTEMIVREYNNGKDDGEWVQGYLRHDCGMWLIYQFEYDRADQVAYEVNPETICQYTGLTDKNGNKIWENDLVKRYYADGEEMAISQIVFSEGSLNLGWCKKDLKSLCMYKDSLLETGIKQRGAKECDVIGNIFDNPELLGV